VTISAKLHKTFPRHETLPPLQSSYWRGMNRTSSTPRSPEALRAAQARLEEAFARHQDELLGTLFYLTGNVEEAHDALQEAFVKCWRNVDRVPQVENLRAWIFRIALNTGRDGRRAAWNRKRQPMPPEAAMLR